MLGCFPFVSFPSIRFFFSSSSPPLPCFYASLLTPFATGVISPFFLLYPSSFVFSPRCLFVVVVMVVTVAVIVMDVISLFFCLVIVLPPLLLFLSLYSFSLTLAFYLPSLVSFHIFVTIIFCSVNEVNIKR